MCVYLSLTRVSGAGSLEWVLSSPFPFLFSPHLHSPFWLYFYLLCKFLSFFISLVQPAWSTTLKDLLSATELSPKVSSSCWHQTFHNLNLSPQVWSAWDYVCSVRPHLTEEWMQSGRVRTVWSRASTPCYSGVSLAYKMWVHLKIACTHARTFKNCTHLKLNIYGKFDYVR